MQGKKVPPVTGSSNGIGFENKMYKSISQEKGFVKASFLMAG
jgi:hypothetical protein